MFLIIKHKENSNKDLIISKDEIVQVYKFRKSIILKRKTVNINISISFNSVRERDICFDEIIKDLEE